MVKLLYRCKSCWRYTLKQDTCSACNSQVIYAHPAKYSPQDRYGKYRRLHKEQANKD